MKMYKIFDYDFVIDQRFKINHQTHTHTQSVPKPKDEPPNIRRVNYSNNSPNRRRPPKLDLENSFEF